MPSVKGTISSQNGSKFVATFIIDEIQYIYSGSLNPNAGAFNVTKATLTYDSTDDLTSTRSYTGQVGISKVTLNIRNGPVAAGPLPDDGLIDPASTVSGTGTWTTA
ncbi:hypothetical protein MVEN_01809000 [Mycena venus]|uniref:Uncharacterized protein n=1 Tax=Mycena venus TaxID=2733690 RepID=A0A8H6XKL0_9AGAR|nr:hypothetical protein MVEN_01809000 [Mycena venus]